MNRTKEGTNKREKVLVTLPESYLTALDNKIDNILIRTRGDAVISLLTELQKASPDALEFEEMIYIKHAEYLKVLNELDNIKTLQSTPCAPIPAPAPQSPHWITARKWLNENTLNEIVDILKISDSASETSALIAIDDTKTALKSWEIVGIDGLRELRKMRAAKKAEAEGAPP